MKRGSKSFLFYFAEKIGSFRPEAVDKTEKRDKLQNRRRETFGGDFVGTRNQRRIGL